MSRVIMFSRVFPKYHPKAGQPTYFVEKFYNSIFKNGDWSNAPGDASKYVIDLNHFIMEVKHHTIRAGHRWKKGDYFSPRVWSGKPYDSKQITIGPDTLITRVYDIDMLGYKNNEPDDNNEFDVRIDGSFFCQIDSVVSEALAKNDGLSIEDFKAWFKIPPRDKDAYLTFTGQIICWSDKIKY